MEFEKELKVTEPTIPGLLVVDLPVHGDNRGWFKENWQKATMSTRPKASDRMGCSVHGATHMRG